MASRATFHGRRRASGKIIAPSRIRCVLTATAPSSVHGSQVSIGPTLMPSQVKNPSHPCASTSCASRSICAAVP
jgi:hypothetical protein